MLRSILPAVLLLGALSHSAPAAQDTDARALLETAISAVAELQSCSYEISSERRIRGKPETASGQVRFQRIAGRDPVGNMLSVKGKFDGAGPGGADLDFHVTYDGQQVLGVLGVEKRVFRGSVQSAGDLLMFGEALLMKGLMSTEVLETDSKAETVTLGETSEIGGAEVIAIECQHGEAGQFRKAVWYIGTADHLPRQVVADYHLRGVALTEVQRVTKLMANPTIFPTLFTLATPPGFAVEEYVSRRPQQGPALLPVGSLAPDFMLKDSSGETHKLSDYRGKVVVLDFWATWCPPCRRAMPLVQKVHERFAENDAVRVFGISTSERGDADPAEFMRKGGFTYGLLLNGETIGRAFMAASLPTFYVIGKDGRVLHAAVGFEGDLDKTIGALIAESL